MYWGRRLKISTALNPEKKPSNYEYKWDRVVNIINLTIIAKIREILTCSSSPHAASVFEIGAGGTSQLVGPSIPKQHYKHPFSLTAWIIFHKLTIIHRINPTSSSTFPDRQSIKETEMRKRGKTQFKRMWHPITWMIKITGYDTSIVYNRLQNKFPTQHEWTYNQTYWMKSHSILSCIMGGLCVFSSLKRYILSVFTPPPDWYQSVLQNEISPQKRKGDLLIYIFFFEIWASGTAQLVAHPYSALQAPLFNNSTSHLPQTDYYP